MSRIDVGSIRFNPAAGTYEARVDINRNGRMYRYPCSVPGTLMTDEEQILQGLTQQAQQMAGREGGLLSVR